MSVKAKYFWQNENEDELHDNPEETTPLNLEAVWHIMQAYADQEVEEFKNRAIEKIKRESFDYDFVELVHLEDVIEIIKTTKQ